MLGALFGTLFVIFLCLYAAESLEYQVKRNCLYDKRHSIGRVVVIPEAIYYTLNPLLLKRTNSASAKPQIGKSREAREP